MRLKKVLSSLASVKSSVVLLYSGFTGFHRTGKNAAIQAITKEEGSKSATVPESAGKLLHERWNL